MISVGVRLMAIKNMGFIEMPGSIIAINETCKVTALEVISGDMFYTIKSATGIITRLSESAIFEYFKIYNK